MKPVLLVLLLTLPLAAQRKPGSQLDNLPSNMEVLTHFGERADISPDNQRVAFMAKSFGDAFVIDLKTREIRCLTCNVPGATFLRVMHLVTGDYILIGPAPGASRTYAPAAAGTTSCGSSARNAAPSPSGWARR